MNFKNIAKRGLAVLLSATMVFSLTACDKKAGEEENTKSAEELAQEAFEEYCDELFLDVLGEDPLNIHYTLKNPENYGVKMGDYTLGEFTVEEIEAAEKEIEDILEELDEFDEELLTERQQLTLETLKSYYDIQSGYIGYSMMENMFGPNSGIVANLPINFIEFVFDDEESVVMYLELLKDTRRYMGQVLDFVELQSENGFFMADFCADSNIEQCQKYLDAEENPLLSTFEEKLEGLDIPDDKKEEYIKTNAEYVEEYFCGAYKDIIDVLTELKGTGTNQNGMCYYEDGKELYAAIVRDQTSSDLTPEEVIELLEDELTSIITTIQSLYLMDPTILDQYYEIDFGMTEPQEILEFLADAVEGEFPEPYTKEFVVQYQSEASEIEGTLAYYLTARLDQPDYNSIKINGSAVGGDYVQLYSTLAHEGFPGHLYQITGVNGNKDIPDVCKLLDFIGFTEGYAEYASDLAYGFTGYSEELVEFIVLNDLYGYVIQSRVDLGVNYEGWTREDCVEYFADFGIDEETSDLIFESSVADPGLLLPYTVGHILMRDLRAEAERELDDAFDAVEFNQLIIDTGFVTFEIMEDEVEKYIEEKQETAEGGSKLSRNEELTTEAPAVEETTTAKETEAVSTDVTAETSYYEDGNVLHVKHVTVTIPEGFSFSYDISGTIVYASADTSFSIYVEDNNMYDEELLIDAYVQNVKSVYGEQAATSQATYNGLEYTVIDVDSPIGQFVGNAVVHCDGETLIYAEYISISDDESGFEAFVESISY